MEAQRQTSRRSAMRSLNKTMRQHIDGTHKDYLEPKDLQKCPLTITIQRLPFTTGELPKGVQQFLKPIPPLQIYKWLDQYKPWNVEDDLSPPNIKDNDLPNSSQTEAAFFCNLVKIYLTSSDDMKARPIIPCQTHWRGANAEIQAFNSLCNVNWRLAALFTCRLEINHREREDLTKPHAIAFVTDEAPHQKHAVSKSELTTIVVLATSFAAHPKCDHTVIPFRQITVISGSGRNIRIVQGVFDVENGKLDLRISEIVNFDKGLPHLSASRGCQGDFDTTNCATHVIDFCTSARRRLMPPSLPHEFQVARVTCQLARGSCYRSSSLPRLPVCQTRTLRSPPGVRARARVRAEPKNASASLQPPLSAAGGNQPHKSDTSITGIYAPVRARRLRGDATKEAARPPVKLPDWFAQNFTPLGEGELSSEAETSIQYVNHSDDSWRAQVPGLPPTEPKTGQVDAASIKSAIAQHLEVVLTANGLIVPSPKEYADEPASKVSHLLLLYAADDSELLLDDYMHNLVFELGCDLMTLDTQDIA
ncbi:hypothetical protein DV735_g43, partial [Chaetothyriales sp. CBS 134920]